MYTVVVRLLWFSTYYMYPPPTHTKKVRCCQSVHASLKTTIHSWVPEWLHMGQNLGRFKSINQLAESKRTIALTAHLKHSKKYWYHNILCVI